MMQARTKTFMIDDAYVDWIVHGKANDIGVGEKVQAVIWLETLQEELLDMNDINSFGVWIISDACAFTWCAIKNEPAYCRELTYYYY